MSYAVFDCNRPAVWPIVLPANSYSPWGNNIFDTLEEAQAYADYWVGFPLALDLNDPFDYSGYGDIIEIREVK